MGRPPRNRNAAGSYRGEVSPRRLGGGFEARVQIRETRPAGPGTTREPEDLAERPALHLDLPDDLHEGDARALAAGHRPWGRRPGSRFQDRRGVGDGAHDSKIIMNMN